MINHDTLYVILFAIPIYQILFYTSQLLSFKRKNPSKIYLGLLLLGMTVFLVLSAVRLFGYSNTYSFLFIFHFPVLLSVAPSFFLYILSITRENNDVNKRQKMLLFIPAVIILILNIVIFAVFDKTDRLEFLSSGIFRSNIEYRQSLIMMTVWFGGIILIFFQIVFVVARLFKIIQAETEMMRQQPAYLAYLEWPWVIGISIGAVVFLLVNAVFEMIWPAGDMGIAIIYNLLMLLSGGIAGYLGMKQDSLLNQVEKMGYLKEGPATTGADVVQNDEVKHAVNGFIDEEEVASILYHLPVLLETQKPYLKPDFSIQDLCSKLQVNRRKVSYVLNEIMGKNFYGLINEYRVIDARKLLLKGEYSQLTIEAIGEMVGFQSKSSFNACFKKYTGMTPSEYKNKHRIEG